MQPAPNKKDCSYNLEAQVGYLLRLASQRHSLIFQNHIFDGLTPTQFSTLMRLSEHRHVTQNHLGRLAAMDVATTKGVVDRLRTKGLVRSDPDKTDKRRSVITLTVEGSSLIEKLESAGNKITAETLSPLNECEQATFLSLLQKLA